MNTWTAIISGWLTASFVGLFIGFIVALVFNLRLTIFIKEANTGLWKSTRDKTSSGIKLPLWTFNPFCLPPAFEEQYKGNEVFKQHHTRALKSMKIFLVCLGNFIISVICIMAGMMLFQ